VAVALRRHSPGARFNLARALCAQGHLAEAEGQYREAIRLKPDYAEAHNNLGGLLCDLKRDYEGAVAAFRDALRLKRDDAMIHVNLGLALEKKGRLDEAIAVYSRAIDLDPKFARAWTNRGNTMPWPTTPGLSN
jgi:tetratricopeptide (TPR) repeat protein